MDKRKKIVHICLAAAYIEGWGYQENILSKIHAQMGYDVTVLTSEYIFNSKYEKEIRKDTDYTNQYGIHVKALKVNNRILRLDILRKYKNLYNELKKENPQIIFVHGGQFYSLKDVIKYCKKNKNVKLYIDQHADYYNSPLNSVTAIVLNKIVWGHWMRKAQKYCNKYWGVTPWRCQYLHEVYGIAEEKIDLLVMGGDDEKIHLSEREQIRNNIREQYNILKEDFLIVTGGKIDKNKNIHLLMQAVIEMNIDKIKLLVFGVPDNEMEDDIKRLSLDNHIVNIGWIDSGEVYNLFLASDLAAFPGTHSVLWEQACACGIPCIFKNWEGMNHVDVGGNCNFLETVGINEIKNNILHIYENHNVFFDMQRVAREKAVKVFSYREIAKRAIENEK